MSSVKQHDNEWRALRAQQSEESKAQARDLKEGRDREQFKKKQRGKLKETKREVTASKMPAKSPSLADRFKKARGSVGRQAGQGTEQKPFSQAAESEQRRGDQNANRAQHRDQSRGSGLLAGKFKKAQGTGVAQKSLVSSRTMPMTSARTLDGKLPASYQNKRQRAGGW